MKVTLFVRAPKKPEKRVVVERDVVIGRGKNCNLQVLSNDVSRQHCRLVIGESEVAVRDLGSGNGTFINSQKTEPNVDTPLISGDIVRIGPLVIKVDFEIAASPPVLSEPAVSVSEESLPAASSLEVEPATPSIEESAVEELTTEDSSIEVAAGLPQDNSEIETFLEPVDDDELLPADDDEVADELAVEPFTELDDAALNAAEPAVEEPVPAEPQPGKLKSLFGMFGKKNKSNDAEPETDSVTTHDQSVEIADGATSEPLLVTDNADFDEETVVVDAGNAFTPDEDEMEILADEVEELSDEEDYLDDEIEEEETVDPGFADFLSNVDQPPT
jgi:pSer/pThr/pTyr-binding forkhead associated (FHA) protein